MQKVYSVGQVNAYIKNMFVQDFVLNRIQVRGKYRIVNTTPPGIFIFL